MKNARDCLRSGMTPEALTKKLIDETCAIRFEGDGYSKEWIQEAWDKGLYVNSNFATNIKNIKTSGEILVTSGVYTENELNAKFEITKEKYINTV
jgi:glutamine synthetase